MREGKGEPEEEEDFRVLLGLDESEFGETRDYVTAFYLMMRKLHKDDKVNEDHRK